MTPGQQARKDAQDGARRQQQADEKVRELEKAVERLREALRRVIDVGPEALDGNIGAGPGGKIRRICKDALDGGGGQS